MEFKTTVKKDGGTKPQWNETFEFDVKTVYDYVSFHMYDHKSDKNENFIGYARL